MMRNGGLDSSQKYQSPQGNSWYGEFKWIYLIMNHFDFGFF